ncbi:hypothetical protein Hanom_Chr09g00796701 [Helianthus anomalus]
MQNWPIARLTFKLAPTTLYSTTWCHCHPFFKKTLTQFVYFADVAFYLMWQGDVAFLFIININIYIKHNTYSTVTL